MAKQILNDAVPFGEQRTKINSNFTEVYDGLAERLPEIGNYAALRAYSGPVTAFHVRCVEDIFDGGSGDFRVKPGDSTSADNGGTILVDAIGRRWFREFSGPVYVEWFGADPTGSVDSTSAFNAAVLAAYKNAQNVLSPAGEIYSITIKGKAGADYKLHGTVLFPSQVILDLQGSRCIGPDGSAGSTAYSGAGSVMFATGYFNGTAIVSNAFAANETTWRVVGAGVKNATFANSNCPIDATNLQEQSILDGLRWSNCSCLMRLKNSFYLRVGAGIARNSAQAAGQYGVLLHGAAAHELRFDLRIVGAAIAYEVTATNSFSVEVHGSMEEGYANNSIGIRNNGAYCQSWKVHAYCEGVRKGITTVNNGAFFACDFSPAYFSSTEYAVQAGVSGFRACTFDDVSAPDEGVGFRNLMDFSAANNDVIVRLPAKARDSNIGNLYFPTNVLLGGGSQILATSFWRDTGDTSQNLAMCDGRLANKSAIGVFPFEGRHIITVTNQIPFWSVTAPVAGTTLVMDSLIVYDESTPLIGHLVISDFNGTYTFDFIAMGSTVYPLAAFSAGKGINLSANAGYYQLTVTGLNTNSGSSYLSKGFVRIM